MIWRKRPWHASVGTLRAASPNLGLGMLPGEKRAGAVALEDEKPGILYRATPGCSSKCRPHSRPRPKNRVSSSRMPDSHCRVVWTSPIETRSEEHTSDLQSLMRIPYAV